MFTAGILFALLVSVPAVASAAEVRPRLNVTGWVNATTTIPAHLITPAMAQNIGPGSHLLIDIPGEGTFGCTANFVWSGGVTRYLGAAGHCFIPASATATHGPGANYNASGVVVRVCVSNCFFGGETGFTVTGNLVQLTLSPGFWLCGVSSGVRRSSTAFDRRVTDRRPRPTPR